MKLIKNARKNLEIRVASLIERKIHEYLRTQSKIILAIPGGSSVAGIFLLLKKQKIPWERVHIFMVDERLVSLDSPESNFKQAYDSFINYLTKQHKIPSQNIHSYNYFNLPDKQGTEAYKNELRELSHHFDIALLSAGEDSHIASLFPAHETIKSQEEFFLITHSSPKFPKNRMSSSKKLIQKSKTALLFFFGENKLKAYENFQNKNLSVTDCPAKLVNEINDSYVFTDILL